MVKKCKIRIYTDIFPSDVKPNGLHSLALALGAQFVASIFFFVTIMALLICSNETNITTFHDPNLRNEGTNLQNKKEKEAQFCKIRKLHFVKLLGVIEESSPFVEGSRSLFGQHGPGTVNGTPVLARWGVHVPCFYYIYWRSDHSCNEARAKRRHEVTRQVVCGKRGRM